jgi:hypothetical protein
MTGFIDTSLTLICTTSLRLQRYVARELQNAHGVQKVMPKGVIDLSGELITVYYIKNTSINWKTFSWENVKDVDSDEILEGARCFTVLRKAIGTHQRPVDSMWGINSRSNSPRQSGHVPGPAKGVVMVAMQCGPNFVSTPRS